MNVSRTPEPEKLIEGTLECGPKERDEIRLLWRERIERGWLQAQAGQVVDGDEAFRRIDDRIKKVGRKTGLMAARFPARP